MTKIDMYGTEVSPYIAKVLLTAKALGIEVNLIPTDPYNGETRTPEYMAMNPQHCIPTVKDGDFVIWESRAICSYLANKYGAGTGLYPEDAQERAMAERMCYFDLGKLFFTFKTFAFPVTFENAHPDANLRDAIYEALENLEAMLEGHNFAVGNTVTYADHVLIVTVARLEACGVKMDNFKNIRAWMGRCKEWPYYAVTQKGLEEFAAIFKDKLKGHL